MAETKKKYAFIDPSGEPDYPNMWVDTCQSCYGDCDPIDDLYYCGECAGRGWVYEQMLDNPYLTHYDIEQ